MGSSKEDLKSNSKGNDRVNAGERAEEGGHENKEIGTEVESLKTTLIQKKNLE